MGQITIDNARLVLETNSEKRCKKGQALLKKHIKDSISFQKTVIESIENLLKNSTTKIATSKNSQIEFENMLEVQEQLKEMMKKHWEHWFDEPIPALNNKTPRQAAKTKKGRELLEILLLEYESHDSDRNDNLLKADIPYLKEKLGLKEELI